LALIRQKNQPYLEANPADNENNPAGNGKYFAVNYYCFEGKSVRIDWYKHLTGYKN